MKIEAQNRAELTQVAAMLEHIPVAMLTNIDAEGELSGRPMFALEMDADGAIWFMADLRSEKVEHLRQVHLGFCDMAHGSFVSLSGHGEIDTDAGRIERLWTPLARPWFPDGPESNNLCLLKFVPASADYWDAPSSRMVRAFGVFASMVSGRAIGMGTTGSVTGLDPAPVAGGPRP